MALPKDSLVYSSGDEDSITGDERDEYDSELDSSDLGVDEFSDLDDYVDPEHSPQLLVLNHHPQLRAEVYPTRFYNITTRSHSVITSEIIDEGLRLYFSFLQHEILRNSLSPPIFLRRQTDAYIPRNIISLRTLADRFASSAQRQWIRQQARDVILETLNFERFRELLVGLFREGGVTWERIMVLFYFCTDISVRALEELTVRQFLRIQNWTSSFIQDTVSVWVEEEGGWGAIFQQSLTQATKLAILGFCCFGIVALCIYIKNNTVK